MKEGQPRLFGKRDWRAECGEISPARFGKGVTKKGHETIMVPRRYPTSFGGGESEKDQLWHLVGFLSYITSIPTAQGWLYLAVMLDLYSRAVVGWSMSDCCDEELAENALNMAVARRRPKTGFLHHSDRGCQYTSQAYRKRLEQVGAVVSMSRKGNCWDNAATESFFGSLKEECVGNQVYSSHEQARQTLFEYLEIYYNRQRRHSTLGYVNPLIYEQTECEWTKIDV